MIPTSGPFTFLDVATEWGLVTPFTAADIAAAVGLSIPWSADDLRGRASVLVVSLAADYVEGETVVSSPSNTSVASTPAVATVTGGKLPRTLAWERVSGVVFTIDQQGQAQTTFSGVFNSYGVRQGVYRLKVTDNAGVVAYSGNLTVKLTVSDSLS